MALVLFVHLFASSNGEDQTQGLEHARQALYNRPISLDQSQWLLYYSGDTSNSPKKINDQMFYTKQAKMKI
jgi:hypothetical protein